MPTSHIVREAGDNSSIIFSKAKSVAALTQFSLERSITNPYGKGKGFQSVKERRKETI